MLKNISISNFYSIGKSQKISFSISAKDALDDSSQTEGKNVVNLVNCIVGHNASGKTTVLKAISFVYWLIRSSYSSMKPDESIPFDAHKLLAKDSSPTEIEIEFRHKEREFKYLIKLTKSKILKEYLGEKKLRGYSRVFEYTRVKNGWKFLDPIIEINKKDLDRFKGRENVSVLSSLLATGYLPELKFFDEFSSNVSQLGNHPDDIVESFFTTSNKLHLDKDLRRESLKFIDEIDIGISDFNFLKLSKKETKNKAQAKEDDVHILQCLHKSTSDEFELELINESNGTQAGLKYLSHAIPILKSGGVLIIDEIETGLHPRVAQKLINLFERKSTNPNRAQLFFSTHQHLLMNDRTKTQIFIAEKNSNLLQTEIFRLDDIEGIRNDENFFAKYMAGEYGGTGNVRMI
jgi:AAA15 family ATPase/GTPase